MLNFKNIPWRGIAIVLSIVSLGLALRVHDLSTVSRNTFHYTCTIRAIDSETGARLGDLAICGPPMSSKDKDIFPQTFVVMTRPDGSMELSGIAYEPRILGVGSTGYWNSEVTITRDSPHEIQVPLKRHSSEKAIPPAEQ